MMNFDDFTRLSFAFSAGMGQPDRSFRTTPKGKKSDKKLARTQTTRTERILTLAENSKIHLNGERYDEAFGLLQALYELGPDVQFTTILVKSYVTAFSTDRQDKAEKLKHELLPLIVEKFKVDAEDVCLYGMKLSDQEKFLEAFLFFQLSFLMLTEKSDFEAVNFVVLECVACITRSVEPLLRRSLISKATAKKHFLSQLYEMKSRLEKEQQVVPKQICLCLGSAMCCISECEYLLNLEEKGFATLEKAIDVLKKGLGKDASHQVFRMAMKKIAAIYTLKGRFREAARAFSDAIDATKRANDYESALEKRQDLQELQSALLFIRMQIES